MRVFSPRAVHVLTGSGSVSFPCPIAENYAFPLLSVDEFDYRRDLMDESRCEDCYVHCGTTTLSEPVWTEASILAYVNPQDPKYL